MQISIRKKEALEIRRPAVAGGWDDDKSGGRISTSSKSKIQTFVCFF